MAKKDVYKLWDVVTITEALEDKVNGVIMTVFNEEEYKTDARGVQHKDVLQIAPIEEWEAAYEGMANTYNTYYANYPKKDRIKSFFDKVTKMFPANEILRLAHGAKPETTGCGFLFD